MGRKSAAAEKSVQIVAAYCDCVVELGIDKASMGEVASRLGMDRSTVHYYFRTREALVAAAVMHITRHYVERMEEAVASLDSRDRARSLIELLFGPTFHDPRRSTILDELGTLGNREPFFLEQVKLVYEGIDSMIVKIFNESFPNVPDKRQRTAAYAISALAEGTSVLMGLGFSKTHRLAARQVALKLLDELVGPAQLAPAA